jgi:dipeptidyl aminopeptidase/acylaminoacyl peptidase
LKLLLSERRIEGDQLARTQRIDVVARDGLVLPAYLTLPRQREPRSLPLVLIPHGGPAARDWIGWNPEVQLFASRGYAVLQVNFRGSDGFGEAFEEAGHREWGGKMQDDLTDAVKQLIAEGVVDADRVGIYGASYGGYAALTGLLTTPELYRAGAAYAAVTDLRAMVREDSRYAGRITRQRLREEVGGGWDDRARLNLASPRQRASEIGLPVLLGHGDVDTVVPVDHSREMANALRKAGKPFEYLEFEHEIHGFLLEANRIRWYEALIAFFEKNLAPRGKTAAESAPAS